MISSEYTQRLYNALCGLVDATDYHDIQEVGSEPLQGAWEMAADLLNEIDQPKPTVEQALSAAIEFISGCQSDEAAKLTSMLADVLNSLSGEKG